MIKRLFIPWIFILLAISLSVYFISIPFMTGVSQYGLDLLMKQSAQYGVQITNAEFDRVRLTSWNRVTWRDVSGRLALREKKNVYVDIRMDHLSLEARNIFSGKWKLDADNFLGLVQGIDRIRDERVEIKEAEIKFTLNPFDLEKVRDQLGDIIKQAMELATLGESDLYVKLNGRMRFVLNGEQVDAAIGVGRKDGVTVVHMDPEHVRKITGILGERLNEGQVDLISQYPTRAPKLLRITLYAMNQAREADDKDPSVPFDAYKHILWSYLLTKEYGAEFAEDVTDAHEIGDMIESDAAKRMDFHNNALGRLFAREGYEETEILHLVRTDPRVIRSTAQVTKSVY